MQHVNNFAEEVTEQARKLGGIIQQIEGGVQVIPDGEGHQRTIQVNN